MCHLDMFKKGICYSLGKGDMVSFLEDIWCGNKPLKDLFLAVYLLVENHLALAVKYMEVNYSVCVGIRS